MWLTWNIPGTSVKKSTGSLTQIDLSVRSEECFNTLPVPITDPDNQRKCRFVYGYSTDGSDQPCYLLWPRRTTDGHFWLVDPVAGRYFDPDEADYMEPIGLEHFFDAFSLVHKREFRSAAAEALDIPLSDIQHNHVVEQSSARHFQLTPICVPDDPPAKRAKRSREPDHLAQDVGMGSGDAKVEEESPTESDSDSSATNSDFSSEDGSSDASDLDKFEDAFAEFGKLTEGVDAVELERCLAGSTSDDVPGLPLDGGFSTLQTLANVPRTWPLARLT